MQLVHFPINQGAGNDTPFPMVDELADPDVRIIGIIAHDNNSLIALPDGFSCITPADAALLTVNINQGNDQRALDIPYRDLVRDANGGIWHQFVPFKIDLTKCSVRTNSLFGGPGSISVAFVFVYEKISADANTV